MAPTWLPLHGGVAPFKLGAFVAVSYDLYLLKRQSGVDPMDQLEEMEEHPSRNSEGEARMRALADALGEMDSRYQRNDPREGHDQVIQLIADGGLDILLGPDYATFNFPYWESLDAKRITTDIQRATEVIQARTNWELYDPQLEEWVDAREAAGEIETAFDYGREKLGEILEEEAEATAPKRSSWKRLFGG